LRRSVAAFVPLLFLLSAVAAENSSCAMAKNILVTGGNTGIGLALCKLLATGKQPASEFPTPPVPSCHVFLGSRNAEKGAAAVKSIVDEFPNVAGNIEMLQIDVSDDASCAAAAAALKAKGVTLYALVNNAGMGLAQEGVGDANDILNTNFYGPKRVTEAMIDLIDKAEGRIVHTSSGVASMYLKNQDEKLKAAFTNPDLTFEELDATVKEQVAAGNVGLGQGYGISKAGMRMYESATLCYVRVHVRVRVRVRGRRRVRVCQAMAGSRMEARCLVFRGVCKRAINSKLTAVLRWFCFRSPISAHAHPGQGVPEAESSQPEPWFHRHLHDERSVHSIAAHRCRVTSCALTWVIWSSPPPISPCRTLGRVWRQAVAGAGVRLEHQMLVRAGDERLVLW